jgi:hypothetical protein
MSVVEVNEKPVNEIVVPDTEKKSPIANVIKKTRTRTKITKEPITEVTKIIVKENPPEPIKKEKKPASEAQLRSVAKAREARALKVKAEKDKLEELTAKSLKEHKDVVDQKVNELKEEHPNVPVKVVKERKRRMPTVKENQPLPAPKVKAPKVKAPKPPKPLKVKAKRPLPPRRYETSATSDNNSESSDDTQTESDSESDNERKDTKYIRKAERRIQAVKQIDEKLKHHGNKYFQNNLSIF